MPGQAGRGAFPHRVPFDDRRWWPGWSGELRRCGCRLVSAANITPIDEALARRLEASGRYRVLRPIPDLLDMRHRLADHEFAIAVALDVEATGIGADAEVIELAMVRFAYSMEDGRVLGALGTFSGLRQPERPIPQEVTRLTGLDDRAVAGASIDPAAVDRFLAGARVVLAHNAAFDRPLAEALWPRFSRLPWGCSCTEVDWKAEGFESARLGQIVVESGFHFGGHRALNDVLAMLHVLSLPLPTSKRTGLAALLEHARAPSFRVWAERAPFAAKDVLRARGYRWSSGDAGAPKAWYRDVREPDPELGFLRREVYRDDDATPTVVATAAIDRFSRRTASNAAAAVASTKA